MCAGAQRSQQADRLSVGLEASAASSRYSSLSNSRVGSLEQVCCGPSV